MRVHAYAYACAWSTADPRAYGYVGTPARARTAT